ncbi:MAG: hypothetical protein JXQ75_01615, partial [Phycisphaerae bacterium]|nr:hypothetical protein [Phycisphaerae bacterium]
NARRAERAQRRCPEAGLISIHDLAADERGGFEPADTETPEVAFHRVWTAELIGRALGVFERECRVTEKIAHYELFRQRVIEPALEGAQAPSLGELGLAFGLTKREVGNRLVTARRAFQRVLREEICVCASSEEDVASEMRELFETMKAG